MNCPYKELTDETLAMLTIAMWNQVVDDMAIYGAISLRQCINLITIYGGKG